MDGGRLDSIGNYMWAMVAQGFVMLALAVYLDYRRVTSYIGKDGQTEFKEQPMLDEYDDV